MVSKHSSPEKYIKPIEKSKEKPAQIPAVAGQVPNYIVPCRHFIIENGHLKFRCPFYPGFDFRASS
jgi:hypothetical protein